MGDRLRRTAGAAARRWVVVLAGGISLGLGCAGDGGEEGGAIRRGGSTPAAIDVERVGTPGSTTPAPMPAMQAPPPASSAPPPSAPAPEVASPPAVPVPSGVVVRAEKITVDTLVAKVVYAEKIEAGHLAVQDLRQEQDPSRWAAEVASHQLAMARLDADTVYAKEIKVGTLTALQVFAGKAEVKTAPAPAAPPVVPAPSGGGAGSAPPGGGSGGGGDGDDDADEGGSGNNGNGGGNANPGNGGGGNANPGNGGGGNGNPGNGGGNANPGNGGGNGNPGNGGGGKDKDKDKGKDK